MKAWILALMLACLPKSAHPAPWASSYPETAEAIADVASHEAPLYAGQDGRDRTIALLVSLAWFESTFKPGAVGDQGKSHGLFQVQGYGDLTDARDATRAALEILRQSFRVCKARPPSEWLGFYTSGRGTCENGLRESRHRFQKAQWLFLHVPRVPNQEGEL
jgi:hypothetical protein